MAVRIRNDSWKNDHDLQLEDILRKYVREGLQHEEILDFVSRDFSVVLEFVQEFSYLPKTCRQSGPQRELDI